MSNVGTIGIDTSKRSFQVHGATADGAPVLRRKLSRGKVLEFLASQLAMGWETEAALEEASATLAEEKGSCHTAKAVKRCEEGGRVRT